VARCRPPRSFLQCLQHPRSSSSNSSIPAAPRGAGQATAAASCVALDRCRQPLLLRLLLLINIFVLHIFVLNSHCILTARQRCCCSNLATTANPNAAAHAPLLLLLLLAHKREPHSFL
jgi:hypothetical protein